MTLLDAFKLYLRKAVVESFEPSIGPCFCEPDTEMLLLCLIFKNLF